MFVYTSEFCKESYDTITKDWDYEEFLKMYNNIMYFTDLKKGIEMDNDAKK